MLKLVGNIGKSIVADAIQKRYGDSRVYSYDDCMIPTMESYYVDSNEYSVQEFCRFIYDDISKLENESFSIGIVVVYTNLSDKSDIKEIEKCATRLEGDNMVRLVIITSKS